MHGWAIPQDNRMVHEIWSDKNNLKTASVFQMIRNCCVLTSKLVKIIIKNTFKIFHFVGVYL